MLNLGDDFESPDTVQHKCMLFFNSEKLYFLDVMKEMGFILVYS